MPIALQRVAEQAVVPGLGDGRARGQHMPAQGHPTHGAAIIPPGGQRLDGTVRRREAAEYPGRSRLRDLQR